MQFSSPLFLWRKRGKKSFKGVATSLKIPGTQAVWCSWCFISLPYFLPSQERLAVRSAILHQAKTICKSDVFCGCYSANLHYHRRDAGKLSSYPTSACRRSWISSKLSFASLEYWSRNLHKKVHGSGWNPANPSQTRCYLRFNEKHQRNKSKLS